MPPHTGPRDASEAGGAEHSGPRTASLDELFGGIRSSGPAAGEDTGGAAGIETRGRADPTTDIEAGSWADPTAASPGAPAEPCGPSAPSDAADGVATTPRTVTFDELSTGGPPEAGDTPRAVTIGEPGPDAGPPDGERPEGPRSVSFEQLAGGRGRSRSDRSGARRGSGARRRSVVGDAASPRSRVPGRAEATATGRAGQVPSAGGPGAGPVGADGTGEMPTGADGTGQVPTGAREPGAEPGGARGAGGPGSTGTEGAASRPGRGRRRAHRAEAGTPDREETPAEQEARAKEICLRLLTDRARTVKELGDALRRKGVPDEIAARVLERFDEVGLVDDRAFADQWVRSRHHHRGLGKRAIARELQRKGVDRDTADEALTGIDEDSERERARELVARRLRSLPVGSREERRATARKLVGMLARKGYGPGVAYGVVKDEIAAAGADPDELGEAPPDGD